MSAVMAALRWAGKVATGAVPAPLMARLGLPALGGLLLLALAVACWVIGSGDRTERVSRMLLAWRGNVGCLARDGTAPAPRPPRRLWTRRS